MEVFLPQTYTDLVFWYSIRGTPPPKKSTVVAVGATLVVALLHGSSFCPVGTAELESSSLQIKIYRSS